MNRENPKSYYRTIRSTDEASSGSREKRYGPFLQNSEYSSFRTNLSSLPTFRNHYVHSKGAGYVPKHEKISEATDVPEITMGPSKLSAETAIEKPMMKSSYATTNPRQEPVQSTDVNPPESPQAVESMSTTATIVPVPEESLVSDAISTGAVETEFSWARDPSIVFIAHPTKTNKPSVSAYAGAAPSRPPGNHSSPSKPEIRQLYVADPVVEKYREIVYRTGKENPLIFDPHKRARKAKAPIRTDIPEKVAQPIKTTVQPPVPKISNARTMVAFQVGPPEVRSYAPTQTGKSTKAPTYVTSLEESVKTISNAHPSNHHDYYESTKVLSPEPPSSHHSDIPQIEPPPVAYPTESHHTSSEIQRELSNSTPYEELPRNAIDINGEHKQTPPTSRNLVANVESKPPPVSNGNKDVSSRAVTDKTLEKFAPWGPPPYNLVPIFPPSETKSTEKKDAPVSLPLKSSRTIGSRSRPDTVVSRVSEPSQPKPFPAKPPSQSNKATTEHRNSVRVGSELLERSPSKVAPISLPPKSSRATASRNKPANVESAVLEKSPPTHAPVILYRAVAGLRKPENVGSQALKASQTRQPSVHDTESVPGAAPESDDPNANNAHSDSSKHSGTGSQKRPESITSEARKASKIGSDANKTVTSTTKKDSTKLVAPKKPKREIHKRFSFHMHKVWGNPRPQKKLKKPGVSAALFSGDGHSRPPSDYTVRPDFFPSVHEQRRSKSGTSEPNKPDEGSDQQENVPEVLMEETVEQDAENEPELLKEEASTKAENVSLADTVTTKQTVAQRQKSHIFQIASRSPSPNKRRRATAPHDDAIHIGLGSSFWDQPNSPPIQWHPIEIIEQIRIRNVYFSDLPEEPVPPFRYPRNVEEAHFDGSITQKNFNHLIGDLLELHTLQLHLSSLHYLNFDRPSVNSLDLPMLKSLEISSSGFTEDDTTVFNMKQILHNIISILRNCTFPALIYLSVSVPLDVEHERKFTEALWRCILLHRSTLEVINIESPFPNMETRHDGKRRLFLGIDPDITSMDVSGAKDLNLVSFHLFFFQKTGSTEFWRRVLKTLEMLEYIQFWVEGQEYYKFPYDIIKNNCSQLETLSLNVDIRSFADPYSKVPIDFNVFKDTPQLRVLALKGFLMEHVHPKYYLKTDIINVDGLPKAMETLKIMNLNVDKDDLRFLAMENKSLKVLYLDNVGTEGTLGISLDVIVNLLKGSKSSSLESLEIFDGINEASLYGRYDNNTNEDKAFRLVAQLLLKKGLKPSLRAYRTPDSSDFEIIYEDDSNLNSRNDDFSHLDSKYDSWAERELRTNSSHHGVGTKRLVASLFKESSSFKKKKSIISRRRSKQTAGRVSVDVPVNSKQAGDVSVNNIFKNEHLTNFSSSSHTVGGRRSSFSSNNKGSRRRSVSRRKTKPS